MKRPVRVVTFAAAVICLLAAPRPEVRAQTAPPVQAPSSGQRATQRQQPERPYRGLFGGAQRDPSRERSVDFTLSLAGGYDDNLAAQASGGGERASDPRLTDNGGLGSAFAALTFRRGRNENRITGGVDGAFRYYPSLPEINAVDSRASVQFSSRLARRVLLSAGQDVAYRTLFSFYGMPIFEPSVDAAPTAPTLDYAFEERPTLSYNSLLDLTYDLGRRTHLRFGYTFAGLASNGHDYDSRLRQHHGRFGISRDLSRRWAIGGGYAYSRDRNTYLALEGRTQSQGADVSFDYHRTLRSRRRLTLGFAPGYYRLTTEGEHVGAGRESRASASFRARMDLSATWAVNGDYRYGFRYLPGILQPLLANDVSFTLVGLIRRRVDLSVLGLYSKSVSHETGLYSDYQSFSGNARVRLALNQFTALSAGYVFYRYEFGPGAVLPAGMPRRYNRHAIRAGVDIWLPLYR